jgi:hypothetical protein
MAAAPAVFRLLKHSGLRDRYRLHLEKISYTGETMDPDTFTLGKAAPGWGWPLLIALANGGGGHLVLGVADKPMRGHG